MTNNFMVSKTVFLQTKFDERIKGYGHEDTLFGYALEKNHIRVHHISNPVLNGHLETNEVYLKQTKQAIINLVHILSYVDYDAGFIKNVPLLRFYYKIKGTEAFLRLIFSMKKPVIEWLLKAGYINLALFNFYKTGILLNEMKKLPKSPVKSAFA